MVSSAASSFFLACSFADSFNIFRCSFSLFHGFFSCFFLLFGLFLCRFLQLCISLFCRVKIGGIRSSDLLHGFFLLRSLIIKLLGLFLCFHFCLGLLLSNDFLFFLNCCFISINLLDLGCFQLFCCLLCSFHELIIMSFGFCNLLLRIFFC